MKSLTFLKERNISFRKIMNDPVEDDEIHGMGKKAPGNFLTNKYREMKSKLI